VARLVERNLDVRVDRRWLWKGRRVCLFDGTTVSMPDTPENRAEYPLAYNQVPETNFALARIGAVISLSCGAIFDLGICRYAGEGQGEVSLLRRLWDVLRPGHVLLGDRLMSGWVGMHLLKQRWVDTVSRLSAHRRADFRRGKRLGKDDHLLHCKKPTSIRSVDRQTYNSLSDSITVRETRYRVEQPGFRTRSVVVVTTLLDPEQASKKELASLYRPRWNNGWTLASLPKRRRLEMLHRSSRRHLSRGTCPRTSCRRSDEEQGGRTRRSDQGKRQEAAAVALGQLPQAAQSTRQHESPKPPRGPDQPCDQADLLGEPLGDQLEDGAVTHPQQCHARHKQQGAKAQRGQGRHARHCHRDAEIEPSQYTDAPEPIRQVAAQGAGNRAGEVAERGEGPGLDPRQSVLIAKEDGQNTHQPHEAAERDGIE
jgi:hypothetical protein